jgi:Pyruvate/2-oxoacid:ferredoxin oxidoreductase delta subunit
MQNRVGVGCCWTCMQSVLPVLRRELSNVRAYLPETLMGTASRYAYHERCKCKLCGWDGHRGLLRKEGEDLREVNYNYPAGCPACVEYDARRKGLSSIEAIDGFVVVDIK